MRERKLGRWAIRLALAGALGAAVLGGVAVATADTSPPPAVPDKSDPTPATVKVTKGGVLKTYDFDWA